MPEELMGSKIVGRGEVFERLEASFPFDGRQHARAALWGLGGIG